MKLSQAKLISEKKIFIRLDWNDLKNKTQNSYFDKIYWILCFVWDYFQSFCCKIIFSIFYVKVFDLENRSTSLCDAFLSRRPGQQLSKLSWTTWELNKQKMINLLFFDCRKSEFVNFIDGKVWKKNFKLIFFYFHTHLLLSKTHCCWNVMWNIYQPYALFSFVIVFLQF